MPGMQLRLDFVLENFCIFPMASMESQKTYFTTNVFFLQAGTLIDNELNVKPGTPLNMEVNFEITAQGRGASHYCQGVSGQ